jgi:hypothetical protein
MALSTASSSALVPSRVTDGPAAFCAVVCAASAGVHGALVVPHARESTQMAVAFALVTAGLLTAAFSEAIASTQVVSTAAAVLLLTTATAYLLSRTSGIPWLTEHPEPFDTLGVVTSFLEVAAAVVTLRQPNPRRHR